MDTSTAFVCALPEMSTEQMQKLLAWAAKSCVKSDVIATSTGQKLIGVRTRSKNVREYQRLLRTNFVNWGVDLIGPLPQGWVQLLSEDRYEQAVEQPKGVESMDAHPEPIMEDAHAPDLEPRLAKSTTFAADLPPDMNEEQLARLYVWGKSSCTNFDVQQMGEGAMLLVAVRKKTGTVREHQRLLRTNLIHWGVELPAKQGNWLRLLDDEAKGAEENETERAEEEEEEVKTAQPDAPAPLQSPEQAVRKPEYIPCSTPIDTSNLKPIAPLLNLPFNILHDGGALFGALHKEVAVH